MLVRLPIAKSYGVGWFGNPVYSCPCGTVPKFHIVSIAASHPVPRIMAIRLVRITRTHKDTRYASIDKPELTSEVRYCCSLSSQMRIIELPTGEGVPVDDEDYNSLMEFKWHLHRSGNFRRMGKPYVARTCHLEKGHPRTIRMHRQITNCPKGMDVDHKDGDGLNNQRDNLEVVTHKENMRRLREK